MILTADDYGISPAVSSSIRALVHKKRLSAVSCMVTEIDSKIELKRLSEISRSIDIGLHFTLTESRPISKWPARDPLTNRSGKMFSFWTLYFLCLVRFIPRDRISAELEEQVALFTSIVGRPPDFIDGHQHVHQLPVIREALTTFCSQLKHKCYIRVFVFEEFWKTVRPNGLSRRKLISLFFSTWQISRFGKKLNRLLNEFSIPSNSILLGHYDYKSNTSFAKIFEFYLSRASEDRNALFLCHPGSLEIACSGPDNIAPARAQCFSFLDSESFLELLKEHNIYLKRFDY